jgi:hypothetical protein
MQKNIIRISDFLKHNIEVGIAQVFGPAALNEDGTIMPFNDQAALVTHYANLLNDHRYVHFFDRAKQILASWYEWIDENKPKAEKKRH